MTTNRRSSALSVGAAVLVLIGTTAACGASGDRSLQSADELPVARQTATTVADTSTTTTTTLPGEEFDPFFAPDGTVLDAIGIAFDETLDVRALPGSSRPVVASLPPLSGGIVSEGRARSITGDGIWLEVTATGATGWVNSFNLARLGRVRDVTADVISAIGSTPTAPSMLELGELVNEVLVPSDPDAPPAEVILVAEPGSGTTAEVVYDVFPGEFFGDDTSIGSRIVVTGEQIIPEAAFAPGVVYRLVRVDSIAFCTRGVTDDGLCV